VLERSTEHGRAAVIPIITGNAYQVATSTFNVDPHDPLVPGFVLR
jgi:proline racemase